MIVKHIFPKVILPVIMIFSLSIPVGASSTHIINDGDTLWELSERYYGTPFYWEDILSANPGIAGIHYLIPGEMISIPDISGVSSVSIDDAGEVSYPAMESSRTIISRMTLETAGRILSTPLVALGHLVETNVGGDQFSDGFAYPGDLIGLDIGQNQGLELNRVFHLLEEGEEIIHPYSDEVLGRIIYVAGVCRIVELGPDASLALLEHAYLPVYDGLAVVPYGSAAPIEVSGIEVMSGLTATVVAFRNQDQERAYSYNIVYIDRGALNGLVPGDMFAMYDVVEEIETSSGDVVALPDNPVAEFIVLAIENTTSAVMISRCENPELVQIGDRIVLVQKQN